MPKARKRVPVEESDRVRRIRARYYEALKMGHPAKEAARLAESDVAELPPPASAPVAVKAKPVDQIVLKSLKTGRIMNPPVEKAPPVIEPPTQTATVGGGPTPEPVPEPVPETAATPPAPGSTEQQSLRDRIPPNYADMPFGQLRELAMEVSGGKTPKGRAEAAKWVEDFLAH